MTKRNREIIDAEEAAIQAGIAQDPDNPELTDEELSRMGPPEQVLPPALYDSLVKRRRGQRGPQKAPTKQVVTLRLDRDVLEQFRALGEGWQTRVNLALKDLNREDETIDLLLEHWDQLKTEWGRLQRGGTSGKIRSDGSRLDQTAQSIERVGQEMKSLGEVFVRLQERRRAAH